MRAPAGSGGPGGTALAFGEIRTGLLRNSGALPRSAVAQLLDLVPGEPVRQSERPIAHAVSAAAADGVDCRLATGSGGRTRVVGTVLTHAAVVGGLVVQTSAHRLHPAVGDGRRAGARPHGFAHAAFAGGSARASGGVRPFAERPSRGHPTG